MRLRNLNFFCVLTLVGFICAACARAMPAADYMEESAAAALESAPPEEMADGGADESASSIADTRKIVANANISLVVADTDSAVVGIETIASDAGGYLADVNLSKESHGEVKTLRGSMTLRVPAAALDEVVQRLQALATSVNYLNVSRQDVTDQFSDLDAQLRNLRATETELRALLTEVRQKPDAKVEDILEVHRTVTAIRQEIETLQGRKNVLDNQISLSTIWVELIPDSISLPIIEEPWRASGPARDALRALVQTLQGLTTGLIWAVVYLAPLLLVLLIPLAALFWLIRYLNVRRRRADE